MSREAKLAQKNIQHSRRVQDGEDPESKRCDRNLLEKKRRDKFNGLIEELASYLEDRCHTKRSTEKSSILKLTGEYFLEQEKLAAEKAANESIRNVKPAFVTDDEFDFVCLESMNMMVFALDQTGKVVYISDNALSILGYLPCHILQREVFEFIDAQNHYTFQGMMSVWKDSSSICRSGENNSTRFEPFWCHFRRGPFGRGNGFETICCFGAIVRNLSREDDENFDEVSESLIIVARPLNVPVEKTLLNADGRQTEFTSTLNMEAKYDYLDKRVAAVLGFFPSELSGSSLYEFCHVDDLDDLVEYHKVLLITGRITTSYYRHMTKGQSWVWLRSRYHLSYSDWTSKPQAVTCLTWVVPFREVCAKQAEILSRDKESFAQILNGTNSIDGKSTSSNSTMNLPAVASPGLENEVEGNIQSRSSMRRTSAQDAMVESSVARTSGLGQESSVARTPGSEETQGNCTLMVPSSTDMDDNQPIDFQESFQFLNRLNLPMDLTSAQQSLHRFLVDKYMQVITSVNKQVEELGTIQKQIKIQGEIRDLVERLEKERSANDVGNEYATTKEMLSKFEEMGRVCLGSQAVKAVTESAAICSKRLQEIDVQSRPKELESDVASETNQHMTKEIVEQNHSPMQAEEFNSTQKRPDIFFNQESWLQTQAQQAQIQQQVLLANRSREVEYVVTSEENQHMTNAERQRKSPIQLAPHKPTQTQPDLFFNQERWLQAQARQAHAEPDISTNQERQWFQTQTQQFQLQQQAFLAQQMINSQYLPQEQLILFQQQQLLAQQLHQKQLEAEARQTLQQQQQQQQLEHSTSSSASNVSMLVNSPNAVPQQGTLSVHSGMTSELSSTSISQQDSPHSPNDCLYDYQWF